MTDERTTNPGEVMMAITYDGADRLLAGIDINPTAIPPLTMGPGQATFLSTIIDRKIQVKVGWAPLISFCV